MDPQEMFDELMDLVRGSNTIVGDDLKRVYDLAECLLPSILNGFTPTIDSTRGERVPVSREWAIALTREYRERGE